MDITLKNKWFQYHQMLGMLTQAVNGYERKYDHLNPNDTEALTELITIGMPLLNDLSTASMAFGSYLSST